MRSCDILIPAYNSADVIEEAVFAITHQHVPRGWTVRIIVADDGSTDDTVQRLKNMRCLLPIVVLSGPHRGRAEARNNALEASRADIVLFLGADILLRPGALQAHLRFHEQQPSVTVGALGMVRWDPRLSPTPFMEWMVHGGQQNAFDDVLGESFCDPSHFWYGSHISLKRDAMKDVVFSSAFTSYGWEDIDVGRRLATRGFRLAVLHDALALHRHFLSAKDILDRQRSVGKSVRVLEGLYPETVHAYSQLRGVKMFLYRITGMRLIITMAFLLLPSISLPRLFSIATAGEFWLGKTDR